VIRHPRVVVATLAAAGALVAAPAAVSGHPGLPAGSSHWVATWTASPTDSAVPIDAAWGPVPIALDDQTLRMVVTPHLSGSVVRIHLSNRFGHGTTRFGHVTVGVFTLAGVSGATTVLFGGRTAVAVPRGGEAVSDPVHVPVTAFTSLAVSMYLPGVQSFPTKHWNANATSYYTPARRGDRAADAANTAFTHTTQAWLYVDDLDVEAPQTTASIVAFGDSIADGFVAANRYSQPVSRSVSDKNGRYPDDLQRRLSGAGIPLSVANAGIGSNRLLTNGEPLMLGLSGLQRFAADALDVPGVRGVLLQEGVNDLGLPPETTTADDLIAGYQQAIAMAHAAGVRIWLGTLLPASNAIFDGAVVAPLSEHYREQVNAWIRGQHLADGVVDFDAVLRDRANPHVLDPSLAGPDHLHPNLRGYQVMADAVSLDMLAAALTS
jgi:lysophospholipase L1-like esterase